MAVQMTIDLTDATFADLVALVDAARVAGVDPTMKLELDESALRVAVDTTDRAPDHSAAADGSGIADGAAHAAGAAGDHFPPRPLPQLGDAAIRSVVDILTGRQEPPRR